MTTVGVTGASGFIATWLVKTLLERGYTVKASVFSLKDPRHTDHLMALDGAKDRLKLYEANLLVEGAFDELVEGCDGVFHTASPFFFETNNPKEELLDPALKGTENVLSSIAKVPSIKRVVLTSSEAATSFNGTPLTKDIEVDETWWSDVDHLTKNGDWYLLSKTIAEQFAWKFCKEKCIDLVTINPAAVLGPLLQPILNTSCSFILNLLNGDETFPNATFGWVNVKNVVMAHILAYETPPASGRYLMVGCTAHHGEIANILRELYPHLNIPTKPSDDKPLAPLYNVSRKRAEGLGINFVSLKETVKETADSLIKNGFVKTPSKNIENLSENGLVEVTTAAA